MKYFHVFMKNDSGATAIEYGLIAALVALSIVAGAGLLGNSINEFFSDTGDKLDNS